MFLRSGNPLLTFLLSWPCSGTSKMQVTFRFKRFSRLPKHSFFGKNALNLKAIAQKHARWLHDQCLIVNFIVMSRHVTSCHVMSRHVTLCHVMSRLVTSCHVVSRHATSLHVTSCHVMSRPVTSCHVMPRWLSRRVPIPYRISGISSSYVLFLCEQAY